MRQLHFFFIAGENSGDLHGSNLLRALRKLYPEIQAAGLGGPRLEKAGMDLRYNMLNELAIIGLAGVVRNFSKIRKVFLETEEYLREHRPDAIILIDYAGFNIRMAERAKKLGIQVIWYVSPQIWAWHKERVHTLARVVDLMLVIFPFEVNLYKSKSVEVVHVGHPLFDVMKIDQTKEQIYEECGLDPQRPLITLAPGSRKREVQDFLRIMLQGAARYHEAHPETQFALIRASTIERDLIQKIVEAERLPFELTLVDRLQHNYNLRTHADFSWVKSGTSTLESAILGAPHLIVYKVNLLTWMIAKNLSTITFIGLPNIVAGTMIVPELIQDEFTPMNLAERTAFYLENPEEYAQMRRDLARVRAKLGGPGASLRSARAILGLFGYENRQVTEAEFEELVQRQALEMAGPLLDSGSPLDKPTPLPFHTPPTPQEEAQG